MIQSKNDTLTNQHVFMVLYRLAQGKDPMLGQMLPPESPLNNFAVSYELMQMAKFSMEAAEIDDIADRQIAMEQENQTKD